MEIGFPANVGTETAIIDADTGTSISYEDLARRIAARRRWAHEFDGGLAFLGVTPTIPCVVDLLALLQAGVPMALIDPTLDGDVLDDWIDLYRPDLVSGLQDLDRARPVTAAPSTPDVTDAILLATSGSTGNPKFVRLSRSNVLSNAKQIASALAIEPSHRGFAHLPLFYSYGLSILTSHLAVGASVVLTGSSAVRPEFWDALAEHDVTSLPGVPYHFEIYRRMKLTERQLPALRDVTQAGGRLNPERIEEFRDQLSQRGVRLWIMYGQTEATARISVLPSNELAEHVGSVGYALPDGRLTIADPDESGIGEIVYTGPNVMLGYAESRDDVNVGDRVLGTLATGDLGRLDADGRLWISGRTKRIAKVFGTRTNLDDVEHRLASLGHPLAAIASDNGVVVFVESEDEIAGFAKSCERLLGFPPRTIEVVRVSKLPTTPAGKIAYRELDR